MCIRNNNNNRRRKEAQGLLRFPMTSNRRNFPRLILLDSMGRNRENGFGSSWLLLARRTKPYFDRITRIPTKAETRFPLFLFGLSSLVKISTSVPRIETSHDSSRASIDREEFDGRLYFSSQKLDSIGKSIFRDLSD